MNDIPKLFLDAALIISSMFSQKDDSPRKGIFKLGEAQLVYLYTSQDALNEAQTVLQDLLNTDYDTVKVLLAENLILANVSITNTPDERLIRTCIEYTKYRPDAKVLAVAIEVDCEVLVTYDKQHLLNNPNIGHPNTRIVVMSGGEAFTWAKDQIITRARQRMIR